MSFLRDLFYIKALRKMKDDKLNEEKRNVFGQIEKNIDARAEARNEIYRKEEELQNSRTCDNKIPFHENIVEDGLKWLYRIDQYEYDLQKSKAFGIAYYSICVLSYKGIGNPRDFEKQQIKYFIEKLIENNPLNYRFFIYYGNDEGAYIDDHLIESYSPSNYDFVTKDFLYERCTSLIKYGYSDSAERLFSTSNLYADNHYLYNKKAVENDWRVLQYLPINDRTLSLCEIALVQSEDAANHISLYNLKKINREDLFDKYGLDENTSLVNYIIGKYKRFFDKNIDFSIELSHNHFPFEELSDLLIQENISNKVIMIVFEQITHLLLKNEKRFDLIMKIFNTSNFQFHENDYNYNIIHNICWVDEENNYIFGQDNERHNFEDIINKRSNNNPIFLTDYVYFSIEDNQSRNKIKQELYESILNGDGLSYCYYEDSIIIKGYTTSKYSEFFLPDIFRVLRKLPLVDNQELVTYFINILSDYPEFLAGIDDKTNKIERLIF